MNCWEVGGYWMKEKGKVEVMGGKGRMGMYMERLW